VLSGILPDCNEIRAKPLQTMGVGTGLTPGLVINSYHLYQRLSPVLDPMDTKTASARWSHSRRPVAGLIVCRCPQFPHSMQNTLLPSYLLIEIGVRFMGAETGIHETQRIELDLTRRYNWLAFPGVHVGHSQLWSLRRPPASAKRKKPGRIAAQSRRRRAGTKAEVLR
jgi:hypothetical protein